MTKEQRLAAMLEMEQYVEKLECELLDRDKRLKVIGAALRTSKTPNQCLRIIADALRENTPDATSIISKSPKPEEPESDKLKQTVGKIYEIEQRLAACEKFINAVRGQ